MIDDRAKYKEYANAVIAGDIVACEYVKMACKRYLSFFDRDDIDFIPEKADKVIKFIGKLKHFTGSHNNKPFNLEPWQKFIVYSLYGFYHKDGSRMVRNAYIEVARKNGKTALVAALCLYHLIYDGEANAQVILSATSAKQAKICFDMCSNFIKPLDPKSKYFKRYRDSIKFDATTSSLHVVAADASRLDGYNASMFVCDELHEFKDGSVFNVLQSSQGMRDNPLAVCITTAGFNRSSFCYTMRSSMVELLHGKKQDDSQFAVIYTLDKDDDHEDETKWCKSSPNLGVTVKPEYLRQQAQQAKNNPTLLTSYLTKLQNIWLSSSEEWIAADYIFNAQQQWAYTDMDEAFAYLGVDLGSTSDLTCVSVMIPHNDKFHFRNYYFLPSEQLNVNPNRELYRLWQQQGHLVITPGNVTDYDTILTEILKLNEQLQIVQVSYDQWNATQFAINATEQGINLLPYSMSIGSLNRPTKELARLILSGKVEIYTNPIDNFCFENVVIKRDFNDNERPTKETYNNKIDGVLAMVMALGGYLTTDHYDNTIVGLNFG
jgi:phage terminase large subunit-like protein